MKKVFCLMAYSGAGKTEVAKALEQKGYSVLQSYTTRSARSEIEWGHTFCSLEEYEQFKENNEIAAYTYFDGNHYFSTKSQLNETDIYVIDPDGITYLKENVKDIEFVVIYLKVDKKTRMKRMFERGDTVDQMLSRINGDGLKFRKKRFDYQVINYDLDNAVNIVEHIMKVENSK